MSVSAKVDCASFLSIAFNHTRHGPLFESSRIKKALHWKENTPILLSYVVSHSVVFWKFATLRVLPSEALDMLILYSRLWQPRRCRASSTGEVMLEDSD